MSRDSVVSTISHQSVLGEEPLVTGERPWWDELDADFARMPEKFDLNLRDRCLIKTSALSDVAIRTAGAALVSALALPIGYNPLRLARLKEDAEFYRRLASEKSVDDVFPLPPRSVPPRRGSPSHLTFVPDDGIVQDLTFESTFETLNPALRRSYSRHTRNRRAHVRHWVHHDGPRPTIIAVHGFSADLYFVNQWFFEIPWLYKLGCDVLLFTLPFHGPRQTKFSPFSGHGFFAGGLPRINEAFAHAMWDLRTVMNWLEDEHGVTDVGITGISLGGLTSALLASVEPRLKFAIPNVPVVSIADLVMEWQPMASVIKAFMKLTRTSISELRHMLGICCPLTWGPAIDRERLMIVAGAGDRLAPPKHSRLLWDHWRRCRMHWFRGSHLLHFDKHAYLREIARFLAGLGFIDER